MTLQEALSRVCDDAERWNANHAWSSQEGGFEAIKMVRAYKEVNPDLKNITIDYSSFQGVEGKE